MGNQLSQAFPPNANFTETSLTDLKGKVYIVTGASAGVGKELARLLYSHNGTIYVAARSHEKANIAIQWIKERHPDARGTLHYLHLDLNDLESVKPSAEGFLRREKRLDVLFNNAGVMVPSQSSQTKQGHDIQIGTNCLGPFLFTKLLTPLLAQTAKAAPQGSVRVIWVSSSAASLLAPKGGVDTSSLDARISKSKEHMYAVSKAGNVLHALEFRRRYQSQGIASVSLNPGNLASDLHRHLSFAKAAIVRSITYAPVNGAYTELFAGLSPEVASMKPGSWVIPFGRISPLRKDLAESGRLVEDGGSGKAKEFWEWSEKQVEDYT